MHTTLKYGVSDSDFPDSDPKKIVSHLQTLLNLWADEFSSGSAALLIVDGDYGEITLCRVLEFQTHSLIPQEDSSSIDGVVGPNTWEKIIKATSDLRFSEERTVPLIQPPWAKQLPKRMPDDSDLGFDVLKVAIGEIEAGAIETGSNNGGEFVDKYLSPAGSQNLAWCAGFVSWCYMIASGGSKKMAFKYGLGSRGLFNQFENRNAVKLHNEGYLPIAGDLAVWSRCYEDRTDAGHIAIVHSYFDGKLRTIDGNKGIFPAYVKGMEYRNEKWVPGFLGFCDIRVMLRNI